MSAVSHKRKSDNELSSVSDVCKVLEANLLAVEEAIEEATSRLQDLKDEQSLLKRRLRNEQNELTKDRILQNKVTISKKDFSDLRENVQKFTVAVDLEWNGEHKMRDHKRIDNDTVQINLDGEFSVVKIDIPKELTAKIENIEEDVKEFVTNVGYQKSFSEEDIVESGEYTYQSEGTRWGKWCGTENVFVYVTNRDVEVKKRRTTENDKITTQQ